MRVAATDVKSRGANQERKDARRVCVRMKKICVCGVGDGFSCDDTVAEGRVDLAAPLVVEGDLGRRLLLGGDGRGEGEGDE